MEYPGIFWTALAILSLLEVITSDKAVLDIGMDDLPLTKSLGYSISNNLRNLEDAVLNQKYLEQYKEILKASQDYAIIRDVDYEHRKQDGRRQRHAYQVYSPVGRRRARSEALRREKLNSQSLRSHLEHTRHSSSESNTQESEEN